MKQLFRWMLVIILGSVSVGGATFVVTKPADTNDGVCDADCTLREAVAAADMAPTDDVIEFNDFIVGIGALTLTSGELSISGNGDLAIHGPPSHFFTLNGTNQFRVLRVSEAATVSIEGMTIRNGNATSADTGMGGCVLNNGKLTLTYIILTNCHASSSGAAIANFGGSAELTFINSTISTNQTYTAGSKGGGITNSGTLRLYDSTVTGNMATRGAGIYSDTTADTRIIHSIVEHNDTFTDLTGNGGGIANNGNLTIENATICNNHAAASGGGIFNDGIASIESSTICSNLAGNVPSSVGGGIYNASPGVATLHNTLIGDNLVRLTLPSDFDGELTSGGYNLIESFAGTIVGGDQTGNIFGKDADLLPLANYGGLTKTVPFQAFSLAIDTGDPNNLVSTDQRGVARPQDGDLNGSARSDIGAYERQPNIFVVTTTVDTNDGQCDSQCSLREALAAANTSSFPDDVITFDPVLFSVPQTITLSVGGLQMTSLFGTLLIQGTGANLLTLSGNDQFQVLKNASNAIGAADGLRMSHGRADGSGGGFANEGGRFVLLNSEITESYGTSDGSALFNYKNMSVRNCVIHGNPVLNLSLGILNVSEASNITISDSRVDGSQVGIRNEGIMTIINTTFSGNQTPIYNRDKGNMTIEGSTISGNTASLYSYGQLANGHRNSLTIINSTIANNIIETSCAFLNEGSSVLFINSTIAENISSSGTYGCGAANVQEFGFSIGTITSRNTTFADNGPPNNGYDYFGPLTSQGHNLIENLRSTTITGDTTGNITSLDPMLGPLSNNGGPTFTKMPLPGSPLVDAADPIVFPDSDQRGFMRPVDGDGNGIIRADIGAVESGPRIPNSGTALFDYDGDHKSDISVFRPSNGAWYLQESQAGFFGISFGVSTDNIAPADFDGDGKTDIAVYRPSTGVWYVFNSSNGTVSYYVFGLAEDFPTPADYDGDGRADVSVFRPSTGTWYRQDSSNGAFHGVQFGASEDKPTVGDFDGDGKSDIAVFRPSTGAWYRINSGNGSIYGELFGFGTDVITPADYDGDGKTDLAAFRPSSGIWYLKYSSNGAYDYKVFGLANDIPTPADYDGDGKADISVFRQSDGNWYRQNSSNGQFIAFPFGQNGDKPTMTAFRY